MSDLNNYIKSYRDFPTQGIVFRDVLTLLQEPELFKNLISKMSSTKIITDAEAIISIDARGFIFGTAISLKTSKPMIVARKKGKLPGELVFKNYNLEYGNDSLGIQKSSISGLDKFVIVDDLLATGGTAQCIYDLLTSQDKKVIGMSVVVELSFLKAIDQLKFNVYPVLKFLK